jgi:hypothetical protein
VRASIATTSSTEVQAQTKKPAPSFPPKATGLGTAAPAILRSGHDYRAPPAPLALDGYPKSPAKAQLSAIH